MSTSLNGVEIIRHKKRKFVFFYDLYDVYCRMHLMSLYEERQLLKKMNMAADDGPLPPELHRLRRKLIVRQVVLLN